MPSVILTGGPGVGKTTLLSELAKRGFPTVAESARAVIAERLAQGLPPRPALPEFAAEILRRDTEKYLATQNTPGVVFFDRSAIEALGFLHEVAPLPPDMLTAQLARFTFHKTVFLLPPWEAIYTTDTERDHDFAHVERVHASLSHWYEHCGYTLCELPRTTPQERAKLVLKTLAHDGLSVGFEK